MSKTLEQLAVDLYDAKDKENEAKAERIAVEEQILALVDCPEEGSVTVPAGKLKITVRKGFSFSADVPAMMDGMTSIAPVEDLPLVLKREFDEKAYKAMEKDRPEFFRQVSQYVTSKPKKPAVTLKI